MFALVVRKDYDNPVAGWRKRLVLGGFAAVSGCCGGGSGGGALAALNSSQLWLGVSGMLNLVKVLQLRLVLVDAVVNSVQLI